MATLGQPDRVERYEPFFGLTEAPFSIAPDPRFLFASASLSAALAQVAYALDRREPLIVITGEIGTGKTLLCRAVLQQLRRKTFLSVINDPLLERDELLKQLLQDFGVIAKDRARLPETSRHELTETLHAFLRSLGAIQAHAVVIVDEAQHLRPDTLEQIRLLSNIDDERGTLLQMILVGQTELELQLARPELRQLQQRISRRLRLEPLNSGEVPQYIDHRLALARNGAVVSRSPGAAELANALAQWSGTDGAVEFTPEALQGVFELSEGLPRVINLLCDRSLEEACASRQRIIDRPTIDRAARVLGIGSPATLNGTPANEDAPARKAEARPQDPFWSLMRSELPGPNEAVQPVNGAVAVEIEASDRPDPAPRRGRLLLASGLVLGVAVAIWFGFRAAGSSSAPPRPSAAAPASTATSSSARAASVPVGAKTPVPETAAAAVTPTPPESSAPVPARAAAAQVADAEVFEIVVASFRTEARATAVEAEIAALGLPIRRRALEGWQQVISGPFASRTAAEEAQQRLVRAGLGRTQVVRAAR